MKNDTIFLIVVFVIIIAIAYYIYEKFVGGIETAGKYIVNGLEGIGKDIVGGATTVEKDVLGGLNTIKTDIVSGAEGIGKDIVGGATTVEKDVIGGLNTIKTDIVSGAEGIGKDIVGGTEVIAKTERKIEKSLYNVGVTGIKDLYHFEVTPFIGLGKSIMRENRNFINDFHDFIKTVGHDTVTFQRTLLGLDKTVNTDFERGINEIKSGIVSIPGTIVKDVTASVSDVGNAVKTGANDVVNVIKNLFNFRW